MAGSVYFLVRLDTPTQFDPPTPRFLTNTGTSPPSFPRTSLLSGCWTDLAEDLVKVALVRQVGEHHQQGEEQEGDHRLPNVYDVLNVSHC